MNTQNQKTIFITGSSSGLGRASASLFASRGWKVIATMRNPDKETELSKLAGVVLLLLDVTDPKQIKEAADKAVALGGVDVVFNNAGYGMAGPLEGLADEKMVRMVETNLMGAIRTTKAFVPYFLRLVWTFLASKSSSKCDASHEGSIARRVTGNKST